MTCWTPFDGSYQRPGACVNNGPSKALEVALGQRFRLNECQIRSGFSLSKTRRWCQSCSSPSCANPRIEIIGTARTGRGAEALTRLPDLMTVDINMPKMNGFELTRRVMETDPVPVVIVNASWRPEEVATTFQAVEAARSRSSASRGPGHPDHAREARHLLETVLAMSEVKVIRPGLDRARPQERPPPSPVNRPRPPRQPPAGGRRYRRSTGGPLGFKQSSAASPRFPRSPRDRPAHSCRDFCKGWWGLAWLHDRFRADRQRGNTSLPGNAYFAPDGYHMGVAADRRLFLTLEATPTCGLRPSVTRLSALSRKDIDRIRRAYFSPEWAETAPSS